MSFNWISNSRSTLLFTVVFVFLSLIGRAQPAKTDSILQLFDSYREYSLPEKLFVHTDKADYLSGELLWFKIYCADGVRNQPMAISAVGYVELLDKKGSPVLQTKISLADGRGNGSLSLPISIPSGYYLFRAYTNWMKNGDPGYYFQKKLTIVNTVNPEPIKPVSALLPQYDIQFFPEGGNLVRGLRSRVAFKAVDQTGVGINFSGVLLDQKNDTVLTFLPVKSGIGSFIFTPQPENSYRAIILPVLGNQFVKNLPEVFGLGEVLTVTKNNSSLNIEVQTNKTESTVYLFIHSRFVIKAAEVGIYHNGKANFAIEESALEPGISHITAFNSDKQPVCERLYFKRPPKDRSIEIISSRDQYKKREKVTLRVNATHVALEHPDHLSISVARLDSFSNEDGNDIHNYLWLESDLVGDVESSGYYLDGDLRSDEAAENLMLTQGWRRFKWENILKNNQPAIRFLPEYKGHIISARIVDTKSGSPVIGTKAFLSTPGEHFKLYTANSDSNGLVFFHSKDFFNSNVVAALPENYDSSYRVDILSPFSEQLPSIQLQEFLLKNQWQEPITERNVAMQVQQVFTKGKFREIHFSEVEQPPFFGKADATYLLDDYKRFPSMEEVLREYVVSVDVKKQNNKYQLVMVVRDKEGNSITRNPVVMIDGVPVLGNINNLMSYDPLKVKSLEVVTQGYFLGGARFDGILSFTTYQGDLSGFQLDPGTTLINYGSLQSAREFFSPVYDSPVQVSSRIPDFRSVLYWSPEVTIDKTGFSNIEFFTSDLPGKYLVILQGITGDGPTSAIFRFEVSE